MTPEEAGDFYEEDEDPAEVFAAFDRGPRGVTAPPQYFNSQLAESVLRFERTLLWVRVTFGVSASACGACASLFARWHDWPWIPLPLVLAFASGWASRLVHRRALARHRRTSSELTSA